MRQHIVAASDSVRPTVQLHEVDGSAASPQAEVDVAATRQAGYSRVMGKHTYRVGPLCSAESRWTGFSAGVHGRHRTTTPNWLGTIVPSKVRWLARVGTQEGSTQGHVERYSVVKAQAHPGGILASNRDLAVRLTHRPTRTGVVQAWGQTLGAPEVINFR